MTTPASDAAADFSAADRDSSTIPDADAGTGSDSGVAPDYAGAFAAWTAALPPGAVRTDSDAIAAGERNVGGLARRIAGVLYPASTAEVQTVVRIAGAHRVPIYAISTGRNWGMGSRLPVRDGHVVVDLGRMNRIREINTRHHYAVVEPGVTQHLLYQQIKARDLPLMLNVIGSGKDTSLLGNALDRGVGYFALRADSLSGLEVVLADGSLLHTGFGHYPTSQTTHLYKYGIGPSLDGLFCQSNFGIVTAAGVDLIPRHPASMCMIASIRDEADLPLLVDRLADLRRHDIVRTIVHIANRARGDISISPVIADYLVRNEGLEPEAARTACADILAAGKFGPWSAVAGIMGTDAQLKLARQEIRRHLRGCARVTFLTARKLAFLKKVATRLSFIPAMRRRLALAHGIEPFFGLTQGIPSDAALASVYWPQQDQPANPLDPDNSRAGLLYCLPYIPLTGNDATIAVRHCREVFTEAGFTPYITFNIATSKAMESVINLSFDRTSPEQSAKAHAAIHELETRYLAEGYIPYRIGIQSMPHLVDPADPFWQVAAKLRHALDPDGILSPGRYSLT